MKQKQKSAKDMAFDRERAEFRKIVRTLKDELAEAGKRYESLEDQLKEADRRISELCEENGKLRELTKLSEEDIETMLRNAKTAASLNEKLNGIEKSMSLLRGF